MSIADKVTVLKQDLDEVYEAGQSKGEAAKEQEMWDCMFANGGKIHYKRMFYASDYTGKTVPPEYAVPASNSYTYQMFYDYRGTELPLGLDLSQIGTTGDWEAGGAGFMFAWAVSLTKIYDLKIPAMDTYRGTFQYIRKCKDIEMPIKCHENTVFIDAFIEANALENVTFEGVIGQNGLDLHWSPLTPDSIMSIINALKDYSEDTSGTSWVVTLGSTNLAKLSDTEKAIATEKGWTLA